MFYQFVKLIAKMAIHFYCRHITINTKELLKSKGPLLLAVNHPNSFLDAIILCTLFKQPVYSLARGDAFKGKLISWILRSIKILPVYRISEGVENLEGNYATFSACTELFKKGGIVLIFSEGRCENEWHLRPLKKGTARLAVAAWQQNIPLKILPAGINYNSFNLFGKNVQINMGPFIELDSIQNTYTDHGRLLNEVTAAIEKQLQLLVYEIDTTDRKKRIATFHVTQPLIKRLLLWLPGATGFILHWPLYSLLKQLIIKKGGSREHFDSMMVGLLFVLYPFYLLSVVLITVAFGGRYHALAAIIIIPFCGWCYVQLKQQID